MKIELVKVVSGFQTGVDIAAVAAAKETGFETGGFIPKGFRTLTGSKPEYASLYGAKEHSSYSYKERTWDNVYSSDATLRIAEDYKSAGERCTINALINFAKPHLDLEVRHCPINDCDRIIRYAQLKYEGDTLLYVRDWLATYGVRTLNVAGNAEETSPGIYDVAYDFLTKLFKSIKDKDEI